MKDVNVPRFFRSSDRQDHGISEYQLTTGRTVSRIHSGVYADPDQTERLAVPDWADERWLCLRQRLSALQLVRPEAIGSHQSAGYLLGLPVEPGPDLHVVVPTGVRPLRRDRVVGHHSRLAAPQSVFGVRVNSGSNVLRELAGVLSEDQLVEVFDAVLGPWHGPPGLAPEQLREVITEVSGYRGRLRAILALDRSRPEVASPRETRVRLAIVKAGLPEPAVAVPVTLPGWDRPPHVDLGYPDYLIAIEYEGDHHRTDPRQWDLDIKRYADMQRAGWIVIRITKRMSPRQYCAEIGQALLSRGGC